MNPVLTQIIKHPEFGYILAQAVAFAALGCNDKHVNPLRKQGKLIEGEHFVRVPQRAGMPKIHWTVTGLQTLATALGTDRAIAFTSDLRQWLQSHSALQHQPRGTVAPAWQENDDTEPAHLATWQQPEPLTATDYQEQQTAPGRYSLAELQEMRVIAQSERDGQMLALLDKAISAIAASPPTLPNQPVERVVYVQPQKTTHINFLWNWNGGSDNHGNGSVEAVFIVAMIVVLLSGLWMMALASSVNRSQPVYPQIYVR